jgi:hypothetical protein
MRRKKEAAHIFCGSFRSVFRLFSALSPVARISNIHAQSD